jgi:hypothetical protein
MKGNSQIVIDQGGRSILLEPFVHSVCVNHNFTRESLFWQSASTSLSSCRKWYWCIMESKFHKTLVKWMPNNDAVFVNNGSLFMTI